MEIETRSTFNGVVVVDVDCKYSQISRSNIGAGSLPAHNFDHSPQGRSAEFLALLSLSRAFIYVHCFTAYQNYRPFAVHDRNGCYQ